MIDDRIKTKALQWHASAHGVAGLRSYVTIPCCATVTLNSGLGDQQRFAISGKSFNQNSPERLIKRMADVDRRTAVDPLVVEVVIDADNI